MPGHSVPTVVKVGWLIFLLLPCGVKANVLSLILKALHEPNLLKVNIFVEKLYHTFPLKDFFFPLLYFVIAVTKDHGTAISVFCGPVSIQRKYRSIYITSQLILLLPLTVNTSESIRLETTLIPSVGLSAFIFNCFSLKRFYLWGRLEESVSARFVFIFKKEPNLYLGLTYISLSNQSSHL